MNTKHEWFSLTIGKTRGIVLYLLLLALLSCAALVLLLVIL